MTATPAWRSILLGMAILPFVLGCEVASEESKKSRSPFHRSPADVAMDEPCRFMGTYHKESRQRLEVLRACGAISLEEWKCMAGTLKTLDKEMTQKCKESPQTVEAIEVRQRELYAPCVEPSKSAVANCGLLSSGRDCLGELCP